jgi:hypothetical protein
MAGTTCSSIFIVNLCGAHRDTLSGKRVENIPSQGEKCRERESEREREVAI